eukprot:SAG31_NODE_5602_length_2427_cov_1.982388_1_plen_150_part_00
MVYAGKLSVDGPRDVREHVCWKFEEFRTYEMDAHGKNTEPASGGDSTCQVIKVQATKRGWNVCREQSSQDMQSHVHMPNLRKRGGPEMRERRRLRRVARLSRRSSHNKSTRKTTCASGRARISADKASASGRAPSLMQWGEIYIRPETG